MNSRYFKTIGLNVLAILDHLVAFLTEIQSIYLFYLLSEVENELLLLNIRTETVL
jgi:hypothetical protein